MVQVPDWMKNHWEPLKLKIKYAIIGAIVVTITVVIIITLSKLNEIRHYRVPMGWKTRVKSIVKSAQKNLELAKSEKNVLLAYHHLTNGMSQIQAAKQLIGVEALPKLTGFDIGKMEEDMDKIYETVSKNKKIKQLVDINNKSDNDQGKSVINNNEYIPTPILSKKSKPTM